MSVDHDHASTSPQSLLDAAVRAIVESMSDGHSEQLELLPRHLKDRIRKLLLRRGALPSSASSASILASLLHAGVASLDLSECASITPAHLAELRRCVGLRRLVLSDTGAVVDVEAARLISPSLRVLHLRRCLIDDEAVSVVAERCPYLEEVDLGHCSGVGDRAAASLGALCPRLSSLGLTSSAVSDRGLSALAASSRELAELRIDGCAGVTDEGVLAVLAGCPRMRILIFHNCPGVTDRVRGELEERVVAVAGAGAGAGMEEGETEGQEQTAAIKQLMWTVY